MIAPPTGLKTEEELFSYFGNVFTQIGDVPTVLQDYPFSTGVWMSVPSILRLIEQFRQIQLLKEEDVPSLGKITKLRAAPGRRIAILTRNNVSTSRRRLGCGIVTDGRLFFPEMLSGVYRLYVAGKSKKRTISSIVTCRWLNFENQSSGSRGAQEIWRRRGAIRHATMRVPGPTLIRDDYADTSPRSTRAIRGRRNSLRRPRHGHTQENSASLRERQVFAPTTAILRPPLRMMQMGMRPRITRPAIIAIINPGPTSSRATRISSSASRT